jgi:hypothetical protein
MGYAVPGILMCASVAGIVSTGISINSYLTTNKPKDTGFKVSMAFLVISIFLFFGSLFWIYKVATGGADAESSENAAAVEKARILGGVNLPSTNEVAEAVPNVQAFTNVPSLRAAEQAFNTAVEKTKAQLDELKQSVNSRISAKEGAIQQASELALVAQAKA